MASSCSKTTVSVESLTVGNKPPEILIDIRGFPAGTFRVENSQSDIFLTRETCTRISVPPGTRVVLLPPAASGPATAPASTRPATMPENVAPAPGR